MTIRRCCLILVVAVASAVTSIAQTNVRPVLPPDVYATVGHEVNIYFDNVVLVARRGDVLFDVTCAKGRQDEDRWRFTPKPEDIGDHPLTLTVIDAEMNVLAESEATVHVASADAGAGKAISLMCVGDSLTHASAYPKELWRLFGAEGTTAAKLVGTHHPMDSLPAEVVHEGYGGWSWQLFCTRWTDGDDVRARSPFLRLEGETPILDFQAYCDTNNEGTGPDFITVLLGCNDTFSATEEDIEARIDTMFGHADTLLAEFQAVRPDTQIGLLLLLPPAASQDAFGSNYTCGQTRWQYRRNQHRVVERMTEKFAGREAENIWLLPAHLNVDTVNNYPTRAEPANARTETVTARQANGVHPSTEGYLQIADTIYAWLRGRLAE
ncbi:MAG TPA: hypothetical protein QGH10_00835 [Armatimonadota bacterium]|nr:hypothetical protein [Armatimonadota bacterium]